MRHFSEAEVRHLSGPHRLDGNQSWPPLPEGIPKNIFQRILEYRDRALAEVERRANAGVVIVHAKTSPVWSKRQDEEQEPDTNDVGCACGCDSCVGNDCLSCSGHDPESDKPCTDENCQTERDRAEMVARLKAVQDWLS